MVTSTPYMQVVLEAMNDDIMELFKVFLNIIDMASTHIVSAWTLKDVYNAMGHAEYWEDVAKEGCIDDAIASISYGRSFDSTMLMEAKIYLCKTLIGNPYLSSELRGSIMTEYCSQWSIDDVVEAMSVRVQAEATLTFAANIAQLVSTDGSNSSSISNNNNNSSNSTLILHSCATVLLEQLETMSSLSADYSTALKLLDNVSTMANDEQIVLELLVLMLINGTEKTPLTLLHTILQWMITWLSKHTTTARLHKLPNNICLLASRQFIVFFQTYLDDIVNAIANDNNTNKDTLQHRIKALLDISPAATALAYRQHQQLYLHI